MGCCRGGSPGRRGGVDVASPTARASFAGGVTPGTRRFGVVSRRVGPGRGVVDRVRGVHAEGGVQLQRRLWLCLFLLALCTLVSSAQTRFTISVDANLLHTMCSNNTRAAAIQFAVQRAVKSLKSIDPISARVTWINIRGPQRERWISWRHTPRSRGQRLGDDTALVGTSTRDAPPGRRAIAAALRLRTSGPWRARCGGRLARGDVPGACARASAPGRRVVLRRRGSRVDRQRSRPLARYRRHISHGRREAKARRQEAGRQGQKTGR